MAGARPRRGGPGAPATRVAAVLAGRTARLAAPGGALAVRIDRLLLDGPSAAAALRAAGWDPRDPSRGPRVRHPERMVVAAGAAQPEQERRALARFGIERGFAVALEPARAGLPGVVGVEEGLVGTDDVVAGTGPDVGALGALGCVALRCGPGELASLLTRPELSTTMPVAHAVRVSGRLPRWTGGLELALAVLDALSADGVPDGVVLELSGPTIDAMDVPGRLALCESLALAGRASLVAPDLTTRAWLAARRAVRREAGPAVHASGASEVPPADGTRADREATPDAGARKDAGRGAGGGDVPVTLVDASRSAPAALRGGLDGRRLDPRSETGGLAVEEAWLCGRLEALREAAEVLRDRSVRRGLRLVVVAASQRTLLHALEEGLAADLLRAGATLLPPGFRPEPPVPGTGRVTTAPAASGSLDEVLAGPAVVAASAVAGRVVEPETMRRAHRRMTRAH